MLEQINQAAFAVILVIIVYTILRILFPENDQDTIIDNQSVTSPDTEPFLFSNNECTKEALPPDKIGVEPLKWHSQPGDWEREIS